MVRALSANSNSRAALYINATLAFDAAITIRERRPKDVENCRRVPFALMTKIFKLAARVNSSNPRAVRLHLENLMKEKGSVREAEDESGGFILAAEMEGSSAKELNRSLLSELRKVERKTTLRAEWTYAGVTERYFDYVLKKKS
ncbi:MAG: hypothetical protein ACYCPW_10330 [Nitrososphaerales archaeon]